ncbi:MAG: hypothetical protein ACO1TE_05675 [Prosthecobacter sp.]
MKALLRKNSNRRITIHQLDAQLKEIFHPDVAVTPESIDHDLKEELQIPGQIRGYRLHVSRCPKGDAKTRKEKEDKWVAALEPVVAESIVERREKNAEIKLRLGEVLWHYLFDLQLTTDGGEIKYTRPNVLKFDRLRRKIAAVRAKSLIACAIDSGSSTGYAVEVLLRADAIPFRRKSSQTGVSLVRPSLITNSPSIASLVRHSIHAHEIALRIIGGDVRIERASMCGALSEISLDAWNLHSDISIIGTTGVRPDAGTYAFGCDDILESRIKSRMLEMGTLLRVLIFDSSKCMEPAGAQVFTSLDAGLVDLIVMDQPPEEDKERCHEVECLQLKAEAEGVGVLLAPPVAKAGPDKV